MKTKAVLERETKSSVDNGKTTMDFIVNQGVKTVGVLSQGLDSLSNKSRNGIANYFLRMNLPRLRWLNLYESGLIDLGIGP